MTNNEYKDFSLSVESNPESVLEGMNADKVRLFHAQSGMAGETGELSDIIKKHIFYDKELDRSHIIEEAGDVLWYMNILLDVVGSDITEAMEKNKEKLSKRYSEGKFTKKAALERADKSS